MDLSALTSSVYTQAFAPARQPEPPSVSGGPAGSVEQAGDEQTRGVGASQETSRSEEEARQSGEQDAKQREAEEQEVAKLKARDREVRTHEAAHLAAAGQYATGGASFTYTRGPDGRQYATGGEVGISTSAIQGDPEATLRKMEQVRRAALAPAEPSAQDRQVAAEATVAAAQARQDVTEERREGNDEALKAYGDATAAESAEPGSIDLRA